MRRDATGNLWISPAGLVADLDGGAAEIFARPAPELLGTSLRALVGADAAGTLTQAILPRPVLHVAPSGEGRVVGFCAAAHEGERLRVTVETLWASEVGAGISVAPWVFERTVREGAHAVHSKLTAARTAMELAMESDASPDEQRAAQEVVLRTLGRVKTLLDQLTEAVSVETVGHGESALDAVIEVAMAHARRNHPRARIERKDDTYDLRVLGDAAALSEALGALLDNAVQADRDERGVELRCAHDASNGRVQVRVIDRGAGMAPERLCNAFRLFYSGVGRTGVGLSRARYLAALFGGTVSLTSQESVGTTATLTLSCAD